MIILKDVDGRHRVIDEGEIVDKIQFNAIKLYGMDFDAIVGLRRLYLSLNGKEPITKENISDLIMCLNIPLRR